MIQAYKVQWRCPASMKLCVKGGDLEWHDINGECFKLQEHAETRKSAYWEKQIPVLQWQVVTTEI